MTAERRMTVTAAVACVLVSTVLFPVFITSKWFVAATGAVIVAAATGTITRLRTLPVWACLAAGVTALLLYLNLVFEARHSLLLVIPTPSSIARLWDLAGSGLHDANRYAPPVPNVPGLLLLAAGGVGIIALMTDLIAVRLRSTALAGLPLLVLFSVPVMMNASHNQLANGLVFCLGGVGYLAMLSVDGRERIRVWGSLVSLWRTAPRSDGAGRRAAGDRAGEAARGPDTRALAAAGRRVGLASIVLALCAPVLLPGLHPSKLFSSGPGIGGDGSGAASAGLSLPGALSQTVTQLHESRPVTVFTYRTSASAAMQDNDAEYFRQYVFNTLSDTGGWQVTNYAAGASDIGKLPAPQGLADTTPTRTVTTTVTASGVLPIAGSTPAFLPVPYPATRIRAPGRWLADPDLMVYSTSDSISGRSYSVTSLLVDPTQVQLQEIPALTATSSPAADLQLPPSYRTPALKRLADANTSGQNTEFGKVYALANWLSGVQFTYSLNAATFNNASGLVTFVTKAKAGFCVQYAFAMTVLTRLLGIPARFVVGYTEGTRLTDGSYVVRTTDAHAWTEVYFPTMGWIRVEPTPAGQGTASAPNYMASASGRDQLGTAPPVIPATLGPSSPAGSHTGAIGRPRGQIGPGGSAPIATAGRAGTPWTAVALAVIAAIVLASGLIAVVVPGFSPAQRAQPGGTTGDRRRRGSVIPAAAALAATAALVALALYRLLSRTSGLDLRAGWATVGIAFGAAAAVVLTAPGALRLIRRRWRWMRADDDAGRAHAAWREFHDALTDYGVTTRPSEPPRTLAARISPRLPAPAAAAVTRLALAEERACYAARPAGSQDLRRDAAAARHGVAATTRRGQRWRAVLFPASLLTTLAYAAVRVPEHASALRPRHRARDKAAS